MDLQLDWLNFFKQLYFTNLLTCFADTRVLITWIVAYVANCLQRWLLLKLGNECEYQALY